MADVVEVEESERLFLLLIKLLKLKKYLEIINEEEI